jgi:hypothetical protein
VTRHYYFSVVLDGYSVVISATVKDWDYKAKRTKERDRGICSLAASSAAMMWEGYHDVLPRSLVERLEEML